MNTDAQGNEIGKLFVGGLHQNTTNEILKKYFATFGQIEQAIVMIDNNTQRSRGFGYVKFTDDESVNNVLSAAPHTIDEKEVDAKRCNINMKGKNRRSLKIFVGGVAPDVNENILREFFSQYGNVVDVNLMIDPIKQRHRGFAFVGFDDEDVVKELIGRRNAVIGGKTVEMKPMEPPNARRPGSNFNPLYHTFPGNPGAGFYGATAPFLNLSRPITGGNVKGLSIPNGFGPAGHTDSTGLLQSRFGGPHGNADGLLNLQQQFQQLNGAQGIWPGVPNTVGGNSNTWPNSGLEHWSSQINNGAAQGIPTLWSDNGLMQPNGAVNGSEWTSNLTNAAQECGLPRGIPYLGWQQPGNAASLLPSMSAQLNGNQGVANANGGAGTGPPGSLGLVNHPNGSQALSNNNSLNNSMQPNLHHNAQNPLQNNLSNQSFNLGQNSVAAANMMQMAAVAATSNTMPDWRGAAPLSQHSPYNTSFNR